MKHRERIARYRHLREQPQWKLLAADHAPEIIGLLQGLLMDGERTLPSSVLNERLQRALDQLAGDELSRELPRTAQAYIAHWLAQGWLERRLPEGADQEQYELSTAALQAIRFADGLEQARVAATESRPALVIEQLAAGRADRVRPRCPPLGAARRARPHRRRDRPRRRRPRHRAGWQARSGTCAPDHRPGRRADRGFPARAR